MSISDYVIIDVRNQEVYNKRTGQFSNKLTLGCLYRGVAKRRRRGGINYTTSALCEARHKQLHREDTDCRRELEVHVLLKVVGDSGYAALYGRPHVRINLPE